MLQFMSDQIMFHQKERVSDLEPWPGCCNKPLKKNKIIKVVHIVIYKALFKPLFLVGELNNVKSPSMILMRRYTNYVLPFWLVYSQDSKKHCINLTVLFHFIVTFKELILSLAREVLSVIIHTVLYTHTLYAYHTSSLSL